MNTQILTRLIARRSDRLRETDRTRGVLAAAMLGGLVAACSPSPSPPQDVGNMAYPAPLAEGNLRTTELGRKAAADTGNMAYPAPLPQGDLVRASVPRQGFDTGNMAFPAPLPEGSGPVTKLP